MITLLVLVGALVAMFLLGVTFAAICNERAFQRLETENENLRRVCRDELKLEEYQ